MKKITKIIILFTPLVWLYNISLLAQAEIMIETIEDSTSSLIFQELASAQSPVEGFKIQYDGMDDKEKLNFVSYGQAFDGDFYYDYLDTMVSFQFNGNVGLKDLSPRNQLSLGSGLRRTKLALYESDDNTSVYGMGVTDNTFNFTISNPGASYVFWSSDGYPATAVEVVNIKGTGELGILDTDPAHQLSLGNSLATTKLALYESLDNSSNYGMGVVAGQFRFNIGNPQARYAFFDAPGSGANEIFTIKGNGNILVNGSTVHSSDINRKEKIVPINYQYILKKIQDLPVYEWQYKNQDRRHIGPMAQDFYAAFELGESETTIASIDVDGVALAAIKALAKEVEELKREVERLKEKN